MIAESIAAALLVPRSRSIASRISSERERPTTAARSSSAASRASSSWMSVWRRATAYYAIWFADTPLTGRRNVAWPKERRRLVSRCRSCRRCAGCGGRLRDCARRACGSSGTRGSSADTDEKVKGVAIGFLLARVTSSRRAGCGDYRACRASFALRGPERVASPVMAPAPFVRWARWAR